MQGFLDFFTMHTSRIPAIFFLTGIGLAILAVVLFFRFHLAGVIKGWLFHHGILKNSKIAESGADVPDSEEYRDEISRLLTTSGSDSESLKKETEQSDPDKSNSVSPGTEDTTLLAQQPDLSPDISFKKKEEISDTRNENQETDTDGSERTTLLVFDHVTESAETSKDDPQTKPYPESTAAEHTNTDGTEPTTLLDHSDVSEGAEPTTVLGKTESRTSKNVQNLPENMQNPVPAMARGDGPGTRQYAFDSDFRITKKEIFIHTDEKI